ncbi:MAG: uracil-DNA glycosylase [Oligoflexia bacterium]|nr:uracil-DNA glycosylase [Oligoflexia bacterium]
MENSAAAIDHEPLTWKEVLHGERDQPYFKELIATVERERAAGKLIYPRNSEVFNALHFTDFSAVKVVIVGQDPYHGPNQAHGLSFSVKPGIEPPPSLQNIFKEIKNELGVEFDRHFGCLEQWAAQGVLLLNAVLTVEAGRAGSHANRGWERFTDRVIHELALHRTNLVFMLWGAYAQKKCAFIDRSRHLVLESPHPSPLSASRGFFGCGHFIKANQFLKDKGLAEIDWSLRG